MSLVDDVLKALDRIPVWKRLGEIPAEMDDLKAKLSALEDRLKVRPGETCPACGEHAMRVTFSTGVHGSPPNQYRRDDYTCGSCGHVKEEMVYFKR